MLLFITLSGQSTALPIDDPSGIKFFKGSWKDVLAESKRQNKPVFVDLFTTWCGPCKQMAKEAFPDAKVGEKFNANFVSYQIDAEKGEGIELARKYVVTAYPTSLFVGADGELIHRIVGYGGIKGMLDQADKAIEATKDPNPLATLDKQYEGGKRDPAFLVSYLQKRAKMGLPNGEALDAYLKTIPEAQWSSDKNIELMAGNLSSANLKAYPILLKEVLKMRTIPAKRRLGQMAFNSLFNAAENDFRNAVAEKSEPKLEAYIAKRLEINSAFNPTPLPADQQLTFTNGFRINFYRQTKNVDKYRALAVPEATKLMNIPMDSVKAKNDLAYKRFQAQTASAPDSVKKREDFKNAEAMSKISESKNIAARLNNLAWSFSELMTDPKDLNQALTWSAKSLVYDRSSLNLDTYARLLNKLGRKDEAIKSEQEAITKGKAAGLDTADLEKSLAELKQK
jgi:thiol-disulfide isomerase/thioredoxin